MEVEFAFVGHLGQSSALRHLIQHPGRMGGDEQQWIVRDVALLFVAVLVVLVVQLLRHAGPCERHQGLRAC